MIRLVFGIMIGALLSGASVEAVPRSWTQESTKKTVEAEFISAEAGVVTLRLTNGREARVPIDALIADDQALIKTLTQAAESGGANAWASWRGPSYNGISPDTGLVDAIPAEGLPQLWVYSGAAAGYSGVSIAAGRVYSMGSSDQQIKAFALDLATGEELWSTVVGEDPLATELYNTSWGIGPRSTPTFSAGMIFTLAPLGELTALDAKTGEVRWQKNLVSEFEGKNPSWGYSESPAIDGEKVIVTPGSDLEGGTILALDKRTGRLLWHANEISGGRGDSVQYSSIVPATIHGQKQYVQRFQNSLFALDENGKQIWHTDWPKGSTAVVPTPVVDGNQIYITSGYGAGGKAIEIQPDHSVKTLWQNTVMKNHHGGVVKLGDTVYGFSDAAGFIAQDFATGKLLWNEKSASIQKGSVLAADGKLFALNEEDGVLTMIAPSREGFLSKGSLTLTPQSEIRSPHGKIWTHPVIIGGRLYLRDQEHIVCYDLRN